MGWVHALSPYPLPPVLPTVVVVSHSELADAACDGQQCGVLAWWDGKQIMLDDRLDLSSTVADSIVVHELTHSQQPADMSCREKEVQAWHVQQDFLTAYGEYYPVQHSIEGVCK